MKKLFALLSLVLCLTLTATAATPGTYRKVTKPVSAQYLDYTALSTAKEYIIVGVKTSTNSYYAMGDLGNGTKTKDNYFEAVSVTPDADGDITIGSTTGILSVQLINGTDNGAFYILLSDGNYLQSTGSENKNIYKTVSYSRDNGTEFSFGGSDDAFEIRSINNNILFQFNSSSPRFTQYSGQSNVYLYERVEAADPGTGGGNQGGTPVEKSYTITFKSNSTSSDSGNAFTTSTTLSTIIDAGGDYVSSISETSASYLGKSGYGIKVGKSSNPTAGKLYFNLSADGKVKATKIVVNVAAYNASNTSVTLNINDVEAKKLGSADFHNIEYEFTNPTDITQIKFDSSKYCYIKSVTVYYQEEQQGGDVTPTVAAPTFATAAGDYTWPQSVTINAASGTTVYYATTEANANKTDGTQYTGAIALGVGETTIYAIAYDGNDNASAVVNATYNVTLAAPTFSPEGGDFNAAQSVTLSAAEGATIYYSQTDANVTSATGTLYQNAISVGEGTTTIYAIAYVGESASAVSSATYEIVLPQVVNASVSVPAGKVAENTLVTFSNIPQGATVHYSFNSSTVGEGTWTDYIAGAEITITESCTLAYYTTKDGHSASAVQTAAYTVLTAPNISSPYVFTPDAATTKINETGYLSLKEYTVNGIGWKMSDWNAGSLQVRTNQSSATGEFHFYNTVPFPDNITKVIIAFEALSLKDTNASGWYLTPGTSEVGTGSLSTEGSVQGVWTNSAKTLTFNVTGDCRYFTIWQNGQVATGTNKLASTNAITVKFGPETEVAAPTFSPEGGNFSAAQTVTLSAADGATIYYSLTEANVTSATGTLYETAIPVGEGTTTIYAIAYVGEGHSTVASATYTVTLPVAEAPAFSTATNTAVDSGTEITLSAADGATIYYSTSSAEGPWTPYTTAIEITEATTIWAYTVLAGHSNSDVVSASYTIKEPETLSSPYKLTPNSTNTGKDNTKYIETETEFTYKTITWAMNQWNPSTLQVRTNQSTATGEFYFYNKTAFPGSVTTVTLKFSALSLSHTDASGWYLTPGTSQVGTGSLSTDGSVQGVWDGTAKTLTFTVTVPCSYFTIWQNGKVATSSNNLATEDAIVVEYSDQPIQYVEAPTADVAEGEVAYGTQVTFSTATEGATIKYSTESENGAWTEASAITLETPGEVGIWVKAEKDGYVAATQKFTYTVGAAPVVIDPNSFVQVTDISELLDGDQVIFTNKDKDSNDQYMAMSTEFSSNKGVGVAVTPNANGTIDNPGTLRVFNVVKVGDNYSFYAEGLGFLAEVSGKTDLGFLDNNETALSFSALSIARGGNVTMIFDKRYFAYYKQGNAEDFRASSISNKTPNLYIWRRATDKPKMPVFETSNQLELNVSSPNVHVSCSQTGATVKYKVNDGDEYTLPASGIITLPNNPADYTVAAWSVIGESSSPVITKTYTVLDPNALGRIIANKLEGTYNNGTTVTFTCENAEQMEVTIKDEDNTVHTFSADRAEINVTLDYNTYHLTTLTVNVGAYNFTTEETRDATFEYIIKQPGAIVLNPAAVIDEITIDRGTSIIVSAEGADSFTYELDYDDDSLDVIRTVNVDPADAQITVTPVADCMFTVYASLAGIPTQEVEVAISVTDPPILDEFVFDYAGDIYANLTGNASVEFTSPQYSTENKEITITPVNGTNTTGYYANGSAVRFYQGNTLKFDAKDGFTITSIDFYQPTSSTSQITRTNVTGAKQSASSTPYGSFSTSGGVVTWKPEEGGDLNATQLTPTASQVRFTKIVVHVTATEAPTDVRAPIFTPGSADVYEGATVTVTSLNAHHINYTITPKSTFSEVTTGTIDGATGNITINEACTVTAVGYKDAAETEASRESTARYGIKVIDAPKYSILGGIHIGIHKLTFSHKSSDATIYYLIDGNPETDDFADYQPGEEIEIDRSMTVYAKAVISGHESPVVSQSYTVRSAIESSGIYKTDELNPATMNVGSSSYVSGTYVGSESGVPYSYNAMKESGSNEGYAQDPGYLQMNSGTQRGVVTTFHTVGYCTEIQYKWDASNTAVGIQIYGRNEAYNSVDELYNEETCGELLATLTYLPSAADDNGWITYPVPTEYRYKYVGIRPVSGTLYANYRFKWDVLEYNVGTNIYEFTLNGTPLVEGTDYKVVPNNNYPEYIVPYGTTLHITAQNASHIRYSFSEDVLEDLRSAETGSTSTVDVPLTESTFVYAQGLVIGGEKGTILGMNTRDFVQVHVLPAKRAIFFPAPGSYRAGTEITGRVHNADRGTWRLVPKASSGQQGIRAKEPASGTSGEIDSDGRFSFILTEDVDVEIEASNESCAAFGEDGWIDATLDGKLSPHGVATLFDLRDENEAPSDPVMYILVGDQRVNCAHDIVTQVYKGSTLRVLVDGADCVKYIVVPTDTPHADVYNYPNEGEYLGGDKPLWHTVEGETFDVTIDSDCTVHCYGHNTHGDSDHNDIDSETGLDKNNSAWNNFALIRPNTVAFSYPEGPVPAGRRITINCPGADQVYYKVTYEDGESFENTVQGSITGYNVRRPVTIEAYGLIAGADGPHTVINYTIEQDKIYRQVTDLEMLEPTESNPYPEIVIGDTSQGYMISNTVVLGTAVNNIPAVQWEVEDGKVINPSVDVLRLNVEKVSEGVYRFFYINPLDGYKYYLSGRGTERGFAFVDAENAAELSNIKLTAITDENRTTENLTSGSNPKAMCFEVGDVKAEFGDKYYLAFNNERGNTVFSPYKDSTLGGATTYYGAEIFVLDPDARVYPPEDPVFNPNIEGSYRENTPIKITAVGASTVYYFVAPEGYVVTDQDTYVAESGSEVTIPLTQNCTIYAYGANSAGVSNEVHRTYTIKLDNAPEFNPPSGEIEAGTDVTITCTDANMLEYVVRDANTDEILESNIVAGTEAVVTVTTDCRIEATGVFEVSGGTTNRISSTAGYVIISNEDRIYRRITSTDELVVGDTYVIAYVNPDDNGQTDPEALKSRGMSTITGTSVFMSSVNLEGTLDLEKTPYEIENPPTRVVELTLCETGDADYPYALLSSRGYYIGVADKTSNPEMVLETSIKDNTKVNISFDSGNALVSYDTDTNLRIRYYKSGSSERFKAYTTTAFNSPIQLFHRVYLPVKPEFDPDGGYFDKGDRVNVDITSKYATSIHYEVYDRKAADPTVAIASGTLDTMAEGDTENDYTVSVSIIPTDEDAHEYVIEAYGINASAPDGGEHGTSKVYSLGDFEAYSLVDNDWQIVSGERYLIAYNHESSKSSVKTFGTLRGDGSGIATAIANISEDVITVAHDNTKVTRLQLIGADGDYSVKVVGGPITYGTYISSAAEGELGVSGTEMQFHFTIHESEGSIAKIKVGGEDSNLYIAYYTTGGYFTVASLNMIENSSTYLWPQLFRENMKRIDRPSVSSSPNRAWDADNQEEVYAIGQRVIYVTAPEVEGEKVTIRYTMDGTLPTATNGSDYTGPITFSPGYGESLNCDFRAVAFAEGIKHSKSSVLQHYTSGIHVADITEYMEHANDTENLYVIDGNLGVAFEGTLTDSSREVIVFDEKDGLYNYMLVTMPAQTFTNSSKTAWRGMHGYHTSHAHVPVMALTSNEISGYNDECLTKREVTPKAEAPIAETFENAVADLTHRRVTLSHAALNLEAEAPSISLYHFNEAVSAANKLDVLHRYKEVNAQHNNVYTLEGYVFGYEKPVVYVTGATEAGYQLAEPVFQTVDTSDSMDPQNPSYMGELDPDALDQYSFSINVPIGFNHKVMLDDDRVIDFDPTYMEIFYTKYGNETLESDRIDLTNLTKLSDAKVDDSVLGNEVRNNNGDYDYNQPKIDVLPESDRGLFRYTVPFYITRYGWRSDMQVTGFTSAELKAVVVIKPNAYMVDAWKNDARQMPLGTAQALWPELFSELANAPRLAPSRAGEETVSVAVGPAKVLSLDDKIMTGVEDIIADGYATEELDAEATYFNLLGVQMPTDRVQRGVYIKVKGNKASKVYVK